MTQRKQQTAQIERTISQSTKALITAKCQISDLYSDILNAMELVYGESRSDEVYDKLGDILRPIHELVDSYIIESIDCNIGHIDSNEY